jgi:hypothetical protein
MSDAMTYSERTHWAQRLQEARSEADYQRIIADMLAGDVSSSGQRGCLVDMHIYRVDAVAAVATLTTTQAYPVDFSTVRAGPASVVAMAGTVASAVDADAAGMEFAVKVNGTEDIGTTGQALSFIPYSMVFSKNSPMFWLPGRGVPLKAGDRWTVTFKNTTAGTITPSFCLFVKHWG